MISHRGEEGETRGWRMCMTLLENFKANWSHPDLGPYHIYSVSLQQLRGCALSDHRYNPIIPNLEGL